MPAKPPTGGVTDAASHSCSNFLFYLFPQFRKITNREQLKKGEKKACGRIIAGEVDADRQTSVDEGGGRKGWEKKRKRRGVDEDEYESFGIDLRSPSGSTRCLEAMDYQFPLFHTPRR